MKRLFYISIFLNLFFIVGAAYAVFKIGSPTYLIYLIKNRGQGITSIKKHKTSHLKTLPKTEGKIVMLGNSITAECEWAELLQNVNILNRGVMGDGTADILNRLDDIIALKPRKVFLLIGINDLQFLPLSTIVQNYENIVVQLKTGLPDTKIYLESILPIHNILRRSGLKNAQIDSLNKSIEQIAQKKGLIYVDLNEKFKEQNESSNQGGLRKAFSLDGIHLNGAGYLLFKDIILPYIND